MTDALAVASWWLIIQVLGLAAWPLAFRLLRWLPDRGYTLAKPLGLLLVSYVLWLLASLRILPNTLPGILIAFLIVILFSIGIFRRAHAARALIDCLREQRGLIIAYELLFAVALVGWVIFRAHVPDISTAEKPMEMAFINAVRRSAIFPPPDPWLAGYPIAYYYFGYVMMSLFSKLSGLDAGITFSLGNAFWFALSAASAFAVVANLVVLTASKIKAAIVFGTLGAIMLVLMGNFEAPLEVGRVVGLGTSQFWQWLDVQDLSEPYTPPPDGRIAWPLRSDDGWWWRASWLIHDYPAASISPQLAAITGKRPDPNTTFEGLIDEFPQFSFLLGDLHPHSMNLPFVLLAMGMALNLFLAGAQGKVNSLWQAPLWLLYPLVLGGISFMNTWDFPIYGCLIVAAFSLGKWQNRRWRVRDSLLDLLALLVLALGFYLPFYLNFTSQAGGLWPNLFNGTRAPQFFLMFGPFIVIGVLFGVKLLIEMEQAGRMRGITFGLVSLGGGIGLTAVAAIAAMALGTIMLRLSPPTRIWFDGVMAALTERGVTLNDHLLARLTDPWVPLALAVAMCAIILLWRAGRPARDQSGNDQGFPRPLINFALLLFAIGLLLAFAAEFGYVVDIFHSRKNTLFKFYYEAWALWSVASAYAVYYLLSGPARIRSRGRRAITSAIITITIGLGLMYPALAIPTQIDQQGTPMLDAMLATATSPRFPNAEDAYSAVQWLNQNVSGTPIVLETTDDEPTLRPARGRISAWTGLPTLLGWPEHEVQWRGSDTVSNQRLTDVTTIYSTTDQDTARNLLKRYGVEYVYVGHNERKQYPVAGLAKFDRMFPVAFQQGEAKVYRVE